MAPRSRSSDAFNVRAWINERPAPSERVVKAVPVTVGLSPASVVTPVVGDLERLSPLPSPMVVEDEVDITDDSCDRCIEAEEIHHASAGNRIARARERAQTSAAATLEAEAHLAETRERKISWGEQQVIVFPDAWAIAKSLSAPASPHYREPAHQESLAKGILQVQQIQARTEAADSEEQQRGDGGGDTTPPGSTRRHSLSLRNLLRLSSTKSR